MSQNIRFDGHETGPKDASAAVIWLHGLGADAYDFAPIAVELGLPRDLKIRFVFPNAPRRPVTLNGGAVMRAWYDIASLDAADRSFDEPGIEASRRLVAGLVEREEQRGVAAERIVLAGFSQGGAIALHAALRFPRPLAGVVALSAYLLIPDRLDAELSPANRGLPIFMAHGPADPIVPLAGARQSRDRLQAAGLQVQWRTYPVPHAVHPDEIADVGRFLTGRLSAG